MIDKLAKYISTSKIYIKLGKKNNNDGPNKPNLISTIARNINHKMFIVQEEVKVKFKHHTKT
jgi:hypothetical protein